MILSAGALCAGLLRQELPLTLMGAIFLAFWGYCFAAVALSAQLCAKRAAGLSVRPLQRSVEAGKEAAFVLDFTGDADPKRRFPCLPGVLLRYELNLATKDGRRLRRLIDPRRPDDGEADSEAPRRGAYYGPLDYFAALDLLGLFRSALALPQDKEPRLLAMPGPAEETISLEAQAGGDSQRQSHSFQRSDNLIDHRPYVPGDDPRRINWKLYGHAPSNELFVRQGETEPPPHSRLAIIIDCFADPELYNAAEGRLGIDLLCENALALALVMEGQGMNVSLGWSGGKTLEGGDGDSARQASLSMALAYPAACRDGGPQQELPECPDDSALMVLALPRRAVSDRPQALDRFIRKRKPALPGLTRQFIDLAFVYEPGVAKGRALGEWAGSGVRLYNQMGGVHAREIRL
jgi:uncharacterized protein (DUF58 family)